MSWLRRLHHSAFRHQLVAVTENFRCPEASGRLAATLSVNPWTCQVSTTETATFGGRPIPQLHGVVIVTLGWHRAQPRGRPALIANAALAMSGQSQSLVQRVRLVSTFSLQSCQRRFVRIKLRIQLC